MIKDKKEATEDNMKEFGDLVKKEEAAAEKKANRKKTVDDLRRSHLRSLRQSSVDFGPKILEPPMVRKISL